MKRIISTLLLVSALAAVLLTGCNPDNKGVSVSSKVTAVGPASADITLNTSGLTSYAYVCVTAEEEAPASEVVVFATGTETSLIDGENVAVVKGLKAMTDYTAYFAFKTLDSKYYGKLVSVNFTTTDYTEVLTITDITPKGFSMHIEPTEDIIAAGHAIRYSFSDFAYYNMVRNDFPGLPSNASLLVLNDYPEVSYNNPACAILKNFTLEAIDRTYNDDNLYVRDENGEIVYDNEGDEPVPVPYHREMVPGEPVVIYMGEYKFGEGNYVEDGYYQPLFDYEAFNEDADKAYLPTDIDESIYWTGFYEKRMIQTTPPTLLDATIDVEVEAGSTDGTLRITPGEGVEKYCVWVMDNALYKLLMERYLLGHEEYIQWLTTSLTAFEQFGMYPVNHGEPMEFRLQDISTTGVVPETDYHVFVVGIGDAQGTSQVFVHETFSTIEKQLATPVLTVDPVESTDPYKVAFNIKATESPIEYFKYTANYDFAYVDLLSQGATFNDIISQMGSTIDAKNYPDYIAAINSPDGLTLEFASIDDATTIFGIIGYNVEGSANAIKDKYEEDPAIGIYRTPVDTRPRVESDLFSALEGDWTAVYTPATIQAASGKIEPNKKADTVNISIYDGIPYPATLPDSVYKHYNNDKAKADALYEEFKKEADAYNLKTRNKNRLACLGLGVGELETLDPYGLFASPVAGRATISSVFWAFGPKWFLEIASDGTVTVPMNYSKMEPAAAWQYSGDFYVVGVSEKGYIYENLPAENEGYLNFPVVISEDRNTITIKPILLDGVPYYMTLGYLVEGTNNMGFPSNTLIYSEIVLTRGESNVETTSPAASAFSTATIAPSNCVEYIAPAPKAVTVSRTPVTEVVIYNKAGERGGFWK